MNASRFHAVAAPIERDALEVVTLPGRNPSYWYVMYQGREVTSGDLFYCVQWVAHALIGKSY